MKKRVIIAGAGGRDFHNYLVYFKNDSQYEVVAFTATQIPGIEKRVFPKELTSGKKDIPIYLETNPKPANIPSHELAPVILSKHYNPPPSGRKHKGHPKRRYNGDR